MSEDGTASLVTGGRPRRRRRPDPARRLPRRYGFLAERLFGDVHASGSTDTLRQVLERDGHAGDVQAYLGYAGWAPGQLDAEIARGDWIVAPADAESVFGTLPGDVWPNLMRRNAGRRVRAGPARPA